MNSKTPLKDRILAQIERKELRMHSRTFFLLKVASVVTVAAAVLLLTVFIGNFIFFTLRLNGHGELLSLGSRGWMIFFKVFPWWLLALDVVLSALLVWLLRHFQFGYRRPTLYVFLGLAVAALLLGFALDAGTPLNDRLLQDADDGRLPRALESVYHGARRTPPEGSAYRGTIVAMEDGSITVTDPDLDDIKTVLLPAQESRFFIGETVFIIGEEHEGVIQAYDIHPIDARSLPPREND